MGLEPIEPDQEFSDDVKDDLRNVFLFRMYGDEKYRKAYESYIQARDKVNKRGRVCLNQNTLSVFQEVEKIYQDEKESRQNSEQISYNEEDMGAICREFDIDPEIFKKIIDKYNDVNKQIDTKSSGFKENTR